MKMLEPSLYPELRYTLEPLELHGLGESQLYAGQEVIQVKRSVKSQQKNLSKKISSRQS